MRSGLRARFVLSFWLAAAGFRAAPYAVAAVNPPPATTPTAPATVAKALPSTRTESPPATKSAAAHRRSETEPLVSPGPVLWIGGGVVAVLALLTIAFSWFALRELLRSGDLQITTHWGGFGGGLGGWRLPRAYLFLCAALGFGILLVMASSNVMRLAPSAASTDSTGAGAGSEKRAGGTEKASQTQAGSETTAKDGE